MVFTTRKGSGYFHHFTIYTYQIIIIIIIILLLLDYPIHHPRIYTVVIKTAPFYFYNNFLKPHLFPQFLSCEYLHKLATELPTTSANRYENTLIGHLLKATKSRCWLEMSIGPGRGTARARLGCHVAAHTFEKCYMKLLSTIFLTVHHN